MKWFGIIGLLGLSILPMLAGAQGEWVIERFHSDIAIEPAGTVLVTETIDVDFGSLDKHGIYRDLPYVYEGETGPVYTRVADIAVTQDGEQAEVDVTRNDANLRIRVGDPDRTLSGRHKYVVAYRVTGVLQNFGQIDELNWNVTGNEWEAPIAVATARITVPANIQQAACYAGPVGNEETCGALDRREREVSAEVRDVAPGDGFTVAVGYEAGVVPILTVNPSPTMWGVFVSPLTGAIALGSVILGVSWWLRQWYIQGRDRYWPRAVLPGEDSLARGVSVPEKILPLGHRIPISVEYDAPDQLRPAEIGVLLDEKADTLDVSATMVDLASRGYLTITEVDKKWIFGSQDYTFARTDTPDSDLHQYEKELLTRLFDTGTTVTMSSLKNSFYKDLAVVKDKLYDEVVARNLFAQRPDTRRGIYAGLSVGVLVVGGVFLFVVAKVIGLASSYMLWHYILAGVGMGLLVSGLFGLSLSPWMSRKTGYGRELYERALGYKLFVSGTEKYRAKFYEDQNLFVQVLPYAIVFGVTDKLAKAFAEMGVTPPQPAWFHGAAAFNAASFSQSMNSFSQSLGTAMQSSPSSSSSGGGGSSGGGFGGGGGGSW